MVLEIGLGTTPAYAQIMKLRQGKQGGGETIGSLFISGH